MSRIAKMPINIPNGVSVDLKNTDITVKGGNGELNMRLHQDVKVISDKQESGEVIQISARSKSQQANAMAGTMRALISNMVQGVSEGFQITLELVGVGYRAQMKGKTISLSLGFSHPVEYELVEGVTAEAPSNTTIVLKSADKQKLGQVAAEIRAFRPPEPYKGKGIRFAGEQISLKETKKK